MILQISILFISLLYILSGFDKIMNFTGTVKTIHNLIPLNYLPIIISYIVLIAVILIEIIGPITLFLASFYSKRYSKYALWSSVGLGIFTILATYYFH